MFLKVFRKTLAPLGMLSFAIMICIVLLSSLIYFAERDSPIPK